MAGGKTRQNRLRSSLPAAAGFTRLQIDFKYDYMGRRIQKSVFNLDTSTVISERRYLYDGWNHFVEDLAKDKKSADWNVLGRLNKSRSKNTPVAPRTPAIHVSDSNQAPR